MDELTNLCEEFGMAMITSVQLYINDETGASTTTHIAHPQLMSAAMAMSTSLLNGNVEFKIRQGTPEFIVNVEDFPHDLDLFAFEATDEKLAVSDAEQPEMLKKSGFPVLVAKKDIIY